MFANLEIKENHCQTHFYKQKISNFTFILKIEVLSKFLVGVTAEEIVLGLTVEHHWRDIIKHGKDSNIYWYI